MIRFSVVIPVYNVEKYLCRCLESLENQTFKNFETIIVCDKSKDNSEEVVDKYVKRNHNFRKINANNT